MLYAGVALAALGFAIGVMFRFPALLAIIALVFLISIVFSVANHFSFLQAVLTIAVAQAILQTSYFIGLFARTVSSRAHGVGPKL
jgi:hypothetical protein